MNYFKINYNRLENLPKIKYYIVVFIIIGIFFVLILISCFVSVNKKISMLGIYKDNVLQINIDITLSDKIKNAKYLEFNNKITKYKIIDYGQFEYVENKLYQVVYLDLNEKFTNNEVGTVLIKYDNKKIIKCILDLFK